MQKLNINHKEELAKKLDYILFKKKISNSEVARKLGYADGAIVGRWRNEKDLNSNIMIMAQEALERHFDIPMEIWDKQTKYQPEKIDIILKEYENKLSKIINNKILKEEKKIFKKLKGKWYGYIYASNPPSAIEGIWRIETTIYDDYSVVDYWGNHGYLQIGKNQSIIFKKPFENEDLTIIRFSNRHVSFEHFRFVAISNQNNTLDEMVNFGFFSRKKYSEKEAKEILGEREEMQLKLNMEFAQRVNAKAIVPRDVN